MIIDTDLRQNDTGSHKPRQYRTETWEKEVHGVLLREFYAGEQPHAAVSYPYLSANEDKCKDFIKTYAEALFRILPATSPTLFY
jgi:hypothetical protein